MGTRPLSRPKADAFAAELDLGLDCGICLLCLSLVADRLRTGSVHEIRGSLCAMTPRLWDEGLADVVADAVREAVELGVPDARAALAELEARGGRSRVARAIVRQLAIELIRRTRTELRLAELARDRRSLAAPQWN